MIVWTCCSFVQNLMGNVDPITEMIADMGLCTRVDSPLRRPRLALTRIVSCQEMTDMRAKHSLESPELEPTRTLEPHISVVTFGRLARGRSNVISSQF
jgi:hypothetical protein